MSAPTRMVAPRPGQPVIHDLRGLAAWLGVRPGHLDWFADCRSLERAVTDERLRHYHRRRVTSPSGSIRLLEAPKLEMKDLQRQVHHLLLDKLGTPTRPSIRRVAHQHVGQAVVIRFDLESFFSGVTVGRVYGLLRAFGYPAPVAHALAALCTTVAPRAVLR